MTSREAVVIEARSWLGTPYHHHGRIKGVGVDCAMILCEVYEVVGLIPFVDPGVYPHDWHLHRDEERYLGWLEKYGRETGTPGPGDVGVWRFGRCFSHAGIMIGGGLLVHAYLGEGVMLGSVNEEPLLKRPVKYFTFWDAE